MAGEGDGRSADHRAALEEFVHVWTLECSVLATRPGLCWPTLGNRLLGSRNPLVRERIEDAVKIRTAPGRRPWLRTRRPLDEAAGLVVRLPYLRGGALTGTCAFTPDQRRLVADSSDSVLAYDMAEGRLENRVKVPGSPSTIAIGRGGRLAACAVYSPRNLTVTDLVDGQELGRARDLSGKVDDCALSPDERWVASASRTGTVTIWEAPSLTRRAELDHAPSALSCEFSPDGSYLVSGGSGGSVKVWSTGTWTERLSLDHGEGVATIALSPDGARIVSVGGRVGTVRVWDGETGGLVATMEHGQRVFSGTGSICRVSPDGRVVASAVKNELRVWELESGTLLWTQDHGERITGFEIGPDASWLLSGGLDGSLKIWGLADGSLETTIFAHPSGVRACTVSPDGALVASTGSWDESLKVWEPGRVERSRRARPGHRGSVNDLAVSPDLPLVVSAGSDGTLRLWDARTGEETATLTGHEGEVWSCAAARHGSLAASGGRDGTVRLWDLRTGDEVATLPAGGEVGACAFDPQAQLLGCLATTASDELDEEPAGPRFTMWRLTGRGAEPETTRSPPRGRLHGLGGAGVLVTNASEDSFTIRLWDPWRDAIVWETGIGGSLGGGPVGAAVSSDGAWAATVRGGILLWDGWGSQITTAGWHRDAGRCCFSEDASLIATVGSDRALRVWDWTVRAWTSSYLVDDSLVAEVLLPDPLTCVTFLPGSTAVACGDEVGRVHVLTLVGVDPPIPVVSPRWRGSEGDWRSSDVRASCPACGAELAVEPGSSWQARRCPACDAQMRVAPTYLT